MNLINDSELLGLSNLSSQAPAKLGVKLAMRAKTGIISTTNATNKAMFEQMMYLLPPNIQQAIKTGHLQLVDEILYSVKKLSGMRDVYLMESGDNKDIGLTNVDKQKIAANKWTLLCGIQLMSGKHANPASTEFGICDKRILNGEFELWVGSTVIVPNISCAVFDTNDRTDVLPGHWMDFDPQFIVPNTDIKPRLKLASEAEANTNVYFAMHVVTAEKS